MLRNLAIFAVLCLVTALPLAAHERSKPRPREGGYTVSIAGYLRGEGTGTVTGDKISVQISVTTSDGTKGNLSAPALTIKAGHFSGTGTFNGQPALFEGRVDAPDNDLEKAIKGVRLVSTVRANGKYSRLVGFIPALAQAPDDPPPTPPGNGNQGGGGGNSGGGNRDN